MADEIQIESLTGRAVSSHIPDLARLRIEVFREFPYLYDGDERYEAEYLGAYTEASRAVIVIARDGGRIIGAATALPMEEAQPEIRRVFVEAGRNLGEIFYLGESVLLPPYRGRGLGVRFFEHREAHARSFGSFRQATFCAVERSETDPRRPPGYQPLDEFWRRRGYRRDPRYGATLEWREIGQPEETPKGMRFWVKDL